MASVKQDSRRVIVALSATELNDILVQPAKDAGFIDFDPTRILTKEVGTGFEIVFERIEGETP